MTGQESHREFVLQRLDLAAKGGLSDIQPLGGGGDAAQLHDLDEVTELPNIHHMPFGYR